ncbi:HAD domain-containing protein [Roseateles sp. So40a]|uniref:HAD domain-containing protein n=1 Tax=Roseateles sp. So40a TaxID=3400226 RepID=UPI003A85CB3C
MRVLFLDFDGVLHAGPGVVTQTSHWCWLPVLHEALQAHGDVRIVVHSTWRFQYDLDELRELLGALGPRVIGATVGPGRLEGIELWLSEHPDVGDFRVLDDELEPFHSLSQQLIACDPALGMSDPQALRRLRAWLVSG